jgi:hypothetical protein
MNTGSIPLQTIAQAAAELSPAAAEKLVKQFYAGAIAWPSLQILHNYVKDRLTEIVAVQAVDFAALRRWSQIDEDVEALLARLSPPPTPEYPVAKRVVGSGDSALALYDWGTSSYSEEDMLAMREHVQARLRCETNPAIIKELNARLREIDAGLA